MIIDHIAKDFLGAMLRANLTGREAFTDVYAGHFITLAYIGAKDFYEQAKGAGIQVGFPEYEIAKALVQARMASSRLAITPELINVLATSSIHMSLANVTQVRTELGLDPEKVPEPEYTSLRITSSVAGKMSITTSVDESEEIAAAEAAEEVRADMAAEEAEEIAAAEAAEEVRADMAAEEAEEILADLAAEEVAAAEAAEEVAASAKKKKAKKSKAKKVKAQAKVQTQDDITEMSAT